MPFQIAQDSGSTSSSVGSRPVTWPPKKMPIAIGVPNTSVKAGSRSCAGPGRLDLLDLVAERGQQLGRVAAPRARRSGRAAAVDRVAVVTPIRSLPGSRAAAVANGSAGGGAQVASPVS